MTKRLVDQPVESISDESLGVKQYAEVLERFIVNADTPITIGIQGDWGIGKTSLLNMLKELLAPRPRRRNTYHTIYFNTWQYSQFNQEEYLGLSILKGIMAEVKTLDVFLDDDKKENIKKSFNKFAKFVATLGNQIVKSKTGLDLHEAMSATPDDQEEDPLSGDITRLLRQLKSGFSDLVESIITKEGDKLVILIDDLDRIRPVKALEFLEAIKNFLDVSHCVFVVAVDYSVVQSGMAEKLGKSAQELQGKSYFDKIIQVPFNMPVTSYKTDRYIMSLLGWDYDENGEKYFQQKREEFFLKVRDTTITREDVNFFTNITALTVGKNPRSIKRAVNYANLLRLIVQAKRAQNKTGVQWKFSDAKNLYPLACMQLSWPEIFVHFAESPSPQTIRLLEDFEHLSRLNGIDMLFKRVHNPEEVKSNITGFFDEYIALVDTDGDGDISFEEFRPIWDMMIEANLTSSVLKDIDEDWRRFRGLVIENAGPASNPGLVDSIIAMFKSSNWNDPLKFNLLSAGKRFYNLMWDRKQIGSLVSTKAEPVQMYLKCSANSASQSVSMLSEFIIDVRSLGHFGTGDTKVDLKKVANTDNPRKIMDVLLEEVLRND